MRHKRSVRGSIIFEALAMICLVGLGIFMNFELVRRVLFQISFRYSTFELSRNIMLGMSKKDTFAHSEKYFMKVWGKELGGKLNRNLHRGVDISPESAIESKLHYRYPSFLEFQMKKDTKHHMEVTEKCRFPYSSSH